MTTSYLLSALASLFLSAPAPTEDDAKKLQGTWMIVSLEIEGKAEKVLNHWKVVFAGDQIIVNVKVEPKKEDPKDTFKIDQSKNPRQIDLRPGDALKGDPTVPGIYMIDGENLKICFAQYEVLEINAGGKRSREVKVGKRPTSFDDKKGLLVVLKRAKK